MNYTIEIEEEERTLEFTLNVNIWEDRLCEGANIEFDIEDMTLTDDEGNTKICFCDNFLFYLVEEAYKSKIELMLEEDDNLLEAWEKHVEEV